MPARAAAVSHSCAAPGDARCSSTEALDHVDLARYVSRRMPKDARSCRCEYVVSDTRSLLGSTLAIDLEHTLAERISEILSACPICPNSQSALQGLHTLCQTMPRSA